MIYCRNCGVELEENANYCSLCGESVLKNTGTEMDYLDPNYRRKKELTNYQRLSHLQRQKVFLEIAGMVLFSGVLVTFIINFLADHTITWSRYVVAAGLVLFSNIYIITLLRKKLLLLFSLSFVTTAFLLFLLDLFSGFKGWVSKLGIPVLFAAYVIVLAFVLLERKAKQKGLNIIAYSLVAAGLLCVCIDGIISIYATNYLMVGWSLTVMVATILTSSFLMYIHLRLKKITDLKRFFHI